MNKWKGESNNRYQQQQNTIYPKRWQICEENFLRYLNLSYVNPAYHKFKT